MRFEKNCLATWCRASIAVAVIVAASSSAGPARAAEFFDYGFDLVDNSSGGSVLDGYISQRIWADTEHLLTGAQLRIELDQGMIFQDTFGGSDFSFGEPPSILVEQQPSLAFDTQIGINGSQPDVVIGGAVNLGGDRAYRFDSSGIDVAWAPSPWNLQAGLFDLGLVTLSGDAVGRGGVLVSAGGVIVNHLFEIRDGTIYLLDAPVQDGEMTSDVVPLGVREKEYIDAWIEGRPIPEPRPPEPVLPPEPVEPPPVPPEPPAEPDPTLPPENLPPLGSGPAILPEAPADFPTEGLEIIFVPYEPAPSDVPQQGSIVIPFPQPDVEGGELQYLPDLGESLSGEIVLDDLLTVLGNLDQAQLDGAPLIVDQSGASGAYFRVADLPEDAVTFLLGSGQWSLDGENVVFTGSSQPGVPEPGTATLLLLLVTAALLRRRGNRSR